VQLQRAGAELLLAVVTAPTPSPYHSHRREVLMAIVLIALMIVPLLFVVVDLFTSHRIEA
jgi:hypothetical protein